MAKATKKKTVKSRSKRSVSAAEPSLLSSNKRGPWGKDQPMILILSSAIIILIVVTLFMTGWI